MGKGADKPTDKETASAMVYPELKGDLGRAITYSDQLYQGGRAGRVVGRSRLEDEALDDAGYTYDRAREGLMSAQGWAGEIGRGGSGDERSQELLLGAARGYGQPKGGTDALKLFSRGGGVGEGGQGTYDLFAGGGGVGAGGGSTFADVAGGQGLDPGGLEALKRFASGQGVADGGQDTLNQISSGSAIGAGGMDLTRGLAEGAAGSDFSTGQGSYISDAARGRYVGEGNPYADAIIAATNRGSTDAYRKAIGSLEGRLSMAGVAAGTSDAESDLTREANETLGLNLAENESRVRGQIYEAERGRQQQAGLQLPGEQRANLAAQLAASGQLDQQTMDRLGLRLNAAGQLEEGSLQRANLAQQSAAQLEQATQGRSGLRLEAGRAQEQADQARAGFRLQGAGGQEEGAQFRGNLRFQGAQALDNSALARYQAQLGAAEAYGAGQRADAGLRLQAGGLQGQLAGGLLGNTRDALAIGGYDRERQQAEADQPFSNYERYLSVLQGLGGIPRGGAPPAQAGGGGSILGNVLGVAGTGLQAYGMFTGNPAAAAGGQVLRGGTGPGRPTVRGDVMDLLSRLFPQRPPPGMPAPSRLPTGGLSGLRPDEEELPPPGWGGPPPGPPRDLLPADMPPPGMIGGPPGAPPPPAPPPGLLPAMLEDEEPGPTLRPEQTDEMLRRLQPDALEIPGEFPPDAPQGPAPAPDPNAARETPPLMDDTRQRELAQGPSLMPDGVVPTVPRAPEAMPEAAPSTAMGLVPVGYGAGRSTSTPPLVPSRDPGNDPAMTSGGWKAPVSNRLELIGGLLAGIGTGINAGVRSGAGGFAGGIAGAQAGLAGYAKTQAERRKEARTEEERRENRAYRQAQTVFQRERIDQQRKEFEARGEKPMVVDGRLVTPKGEVLLEARDKAPTSEAAAIASGDKRYIDAYAQVRQAQEAAARARATAVSPLDMRRVEAMERNAATAAERLNLDRAKAAGGESQAEQVKTAQSLRKEFAERAAKPAAILTGVNQLEATLGEGSGPGDLAGIISFFKTLDPTSVVSTTESANAQTAGGVPEALRSIFNKAQGQGYLSADLRDQFVKTARAVARNAGKEYARERGTFERYAKGARLDPYDVVGDALGFPVDEPPVPPPPGEPPVNTIVKAGVGGEEPPAPAPDQGLVRNPLAKQPAAPLGRKIAAGGKAAAAAELKAAGLPKDDPQYLQLVEALAIKYGLPRAGGP